MPLLDLRDLRDAYFGGMFYVELLWASNSGSLASVPQLSVQMVPCAMDASNEHLHRYNTVNTECETLNEPWPSP